MQDEKDIDLIYHAGSGDVLKVRELLMEGANINYRNPKDGSTSIIQAVKYGNTDIASFLLENGANINIKDFQGNNLLIIALENSGKKELIKLLLEKEIKTTALNINRKSAFYYADFYNNKEILEMIYSKYINSCINNNINPFKEAVFNRDRILLDKLVQNIKNFDFIDREGDTPLIICVKMGDLLTFRNVHVNGADINFSDIEGKTPLVHAVLNERIEIIKYILEKGGNSELKDKSGKDSMYYALDIKNIEILKILLNYSGKVSEEILKKSKKMQEKEIYELLKKYE